MKSVGLTDYEIKLMIDYKGNDFFEKHKNANKDVLMEKVKSILSIISAYDGRNLNENKKYATVSFVNIILSCY